MDKYKYVIGEKTACLVVLDKDVDLAALEQHFKQQYPQTYKARGGRTFWFAKRIPLPEPESIQ